MFKTVFSRMLCTYLVIVLLTMLLLGFMVGQLFRDQYYDERVSSMVREAEETNNIIAEKYFDGSDRASAVSELQVIARKFNAYIWVIDSHGILRVNDPLDGDEWAENTEFNLQDSLSEVIQKGNIIKTTGFFGDAFGVEVMTIGRPLYIDGRIEGAIYIHTKMDDIRQSVFAIYENVFSSALVASLMAVVLVPWTARRFTDPLVKMNEAAQCYAKGDFSKRVPAKTKDEIGTLAKTFNTMANELQGLDDMRKSFVANASHEMKAPLAAMRGFLEAMLDGSIPPSEHAEYMGIVLDETKRLSNLVTNLLDLSKIESGSVPIKRTVLDVNELAARTLLTFEGRIDQKSINIDVCFKNEYCYVNADPDMITQVLRNLIDNAIKFTPVGGTITVWTYCGKKKAYVAVKDTGCGIPKEDLANVWSRFFKVEKAHTPGGDGTGLGLSIVKKIIEQHGTNIYVTSKEGKGTNFCFELPLSNRKPKRPGKIEQEPLPQPEEKEKEKGRHSRRDNAKKERDKRTRTGKEPQNDPQQVRESAKLTEKQTADDQETGERT